MIPDDLDSHTISLESFRSFKGPLFDKPVAGIGTFFAVSYSKPALVAFALFLTNCPVHFFFFSYLNELTLSYYAFQDNLYSHFRCWKTRFITAEKTNIEEKRTNYILKIRVQNLDQSLNLDEWNSSSSAFTFIKAIHWCSYSSYCELPWVLSCISNSGLISTSQPVRTWTWTFKSNQFYLKKN